MKTISEYIIDPLSCIFNLSILNGIWPDALKMADIVPIHKSFSKSVSSNYKPISLISNIAKIFEKILHVRNYKFVNEFKIISDKQYSCIKNIGTKDALQNISNLLYNKLDKSKPVIIAFLDLAKAFDMVDHTILLDKFILWD